MMIVNDMPSAEYRSADGINASALKKGKKSMKTMKHFMDNPQKDSDTLRMGRLKHTWILEYDNRFDNIAVYDGPTSGKGSRTEFDAFKQANKHKDIVKQHELEQLDACRNSVMGYAPARS